MEAIVLFIERNISSILFFGGEYKLVFLAIPLLYKLWTVVNARVSSSQFKLRFVSETDYYTAIHRRVGNSYFKVSSYILDNHLPELHDMYFIGALQKKNEPLDLICSCGDNSFSFVSDGTTVHVKTTGDGGISSSERTKSTISLSVAAVDQTKLTNLVERILTGSRVGRYMYRFSVDKFLPFPMPHKTRDNHYTESDCGLWDDADIFFRNAKLYEKFGIPHKRGYLLDGAPGTGKTSCVFALANHYDMDVYEIDLALSVSYQMDLVPPGSIIAINDIDRFDISGATAKSATDKTRELLNVFDGYQLSGSLVVLTTNDRSKLDPALIRPGRIDRTYSFGMASGLLVERIIRDFTGQSLNAGHIERLRDLDITSAALLNQYLIPFVSDNLDDLVDSLLE